ncbi:MAG: hypothetical protein ABSE84_02390 [Isosphaeraceae bacterium]|jgi:predicted dehydrogenase
MHGPVVYCRAAPNLAGRVNIVAFAEVDEPYAAATFKAYPNVPRYTDYRKMYDAMERKIDAVVKESYPLGFVLKYTFPARGARPEVSMYFHGGTKIAGMPRPKHLEAGRRITEAMGGPKGQVIVGTEGSIMAGPRCDGARIIPEKKMHEVGKLPWTVEGYGDHLESWLRACREGTPTASTFEFAAAVTEVALLGSIALRHGKKLQWDARNMRFPSEPEADKYLWVELRKGWDA